MWLSDYSLMCKCNSIPAILITRTSLLSDYSLMCKCNSIPAILITRTSLLSDYSLLCKCNSIPAILITRTSFQTINRVSKKRHWVYQWTGHVDYHRKKGRQRMPYD
jgi:hypothetical protein